MGEELVDFVFSAVVFQQLLLFVNILDVVKRLYDKIVVNERLWFLGSGIRAKNGEIETGSRYRRQRNVKFKF